MGYFAYAKRRRPMGHDASSKLAKVAVYVTLSCGHRCTTVDAMAEAGPVNCAFRVRNRTHHLLDLLRIRNNVSTAAQWHSGQ